MRRDAGLVEGEGGDAVLSGAQLDEMSDAQLELAIIRIAVFARVTPAQKLRIV